MSNFEVVIGLEVHVHLATKTKLFCSCPNSFGDQANSNVCEVCSGMPGVLPVLNKKAIEFATRTALAINATINQKSIFARKNYFYPDMPKDYQISQFDLPLCEHGYLDISLPVPAKSNTKTSSKNEQQNIEEKITKRIGITRIHLEDDAGKNIHSTTENQSFVDLNRSGTPLIEIVSEPDMRNAEEAVAYLKALHAIVVNLGVTNGNMEEGSFRCDANVSLRPQGQKEFGTRTELKNLNSFRHVQKAIEYEITRQEDILLDGGKIIQQTRLYDSNKNITLAMRNKEDADDYRYFPDPDLLPVTITDEELAKWKSQMPELPAQRKNRFQKEWNIAEAEAELIAFNPYLTHLLENSVKIYTEPKKIANIILGPLLREINLRIAEGLDEKLPIQPEALAELAKIIDNGLISFKIATDIFPELINGEKMPEVLVKEKGLVQVSDTGAIEATVIKIVEANPEEVTAFRAGKTKLMGFFVGQIMREMKGKGNPALVNEILMRHLKG